jgi:putative ABC transport system permease protein
MNELFGIQMTTLTTVLVALLAVCLLSVAWIALRRRVIFNLGVRNLPRRKAQTVLIVVGLMLSTLIITSALGVGDTVDHSITSEAYDRYGHIDELVLGPPYEANGSFESTIPADTLSLVEEAVDQNTNVDGVMPLLERRVSASNPATNLGEPELIAIGVAPARIDQFGGVSSIEGGQVDLASMPVDGVVLSEKTAGLLDASAGDTIQVYVNNQPHDAVVYAVAENTYLTGSRRDDETDLEMSGLLMRLDVLQELTGLDDSLSSIAISNLGGVRDSVDLTDAVIESLGPALFSSDLNPFPAKQDLVNDGEENAQVFTGLFLVVGLFSIAAGILLILLIFTMLAAERRSEMGMARAVGAQRGQLVQQFMSEGAAYALLAGLVGAALGVVAALGLGYGLGRVFGDFVNIDPYITPRSVVAAYCLGVVITFIAVVVSSWRVSRLNVVAAIRDLPDVRHQKANRRTLIWPVLMVGAGLLLTLAGISSSSALPFMGGVSTLILGMALLVRLLGVPSRAALSTAGLLLLGFWLLPDKQFTQIFGEYDGDFEMFFVSGLFLVISATLVIMQNDQLLLGIVSRLGGVFRSKLPSLRLGIAYPSSARSRTGMTMAMFSLIVFSLVTLATINLNFSNAFLSDAATAGWEVRADTNDAGAIDDFTLALEQAGVDTSQISATGALTMASFDKILVSEFEPNAGERAEVVVVGPFQGMDDGFIEASDWKFGNRAEGYASDQEIIDALLNEPGVAVVDTFTVQGGDGFDDEETGSTPLDSIDLDEETFAPVTLEYPAADGSFHPVTVIGVIDSSLSSFEGVYAGQSTVDAIYDNVGSVSYRVQLVDDDQDEEMAREIESALLPYGVQGTSITEQIESDQQETNGFFLILQAFMGLGMLVGVAAIGVIAFRNVVDRRQQIGVLRALGFQQNQVSLSFLIESAFIVGLGVVSGTALGLTLARNLMTSGEIAEAGNIDFVVPWDTVSIVLALAVGAALLMTWLPARQASRIAPAEALRYE